MGRPIVLSNGELHVGINNFGMVHDFYYPYVGSENHSAGADTRHKVGVWVDDRVSWIDEPSWKHNFRIAEGALVGHSSVVNKSIGILLEFDDTVVSDINAFVRSIHVVNLNSEKRDIRIFTHQAFNISDSASNTDTVQYLPDSKAILHYRGDRMFVISGSSSQSESFNQHSVGLFGIEGKQGTWRDADDGELSNNAVEHGRVDSTLGFNLSLKGYESAHVQYWVCAGTSLRQALDVNSTVRKFGVSHLIHTTAVWWHDWLEPARSVSKKLPKERRKHFLSSIIVIKSHIDKRGAVMASTDSTMLNYSRDAYAYCWPRDAAYALWPLMRLGYEDEARAFFDFARDSLHPGGYLMHKYRADGALGSSWHPYHHGTSVSPPIQEDETALTLFVFAQFYRLSAASNLIDEYYKSFVLPMAEFLAEHIDQSTGLPKPTYDLWEQTYQTSTYTTAVTYAALLAASELAEQAGDGDNAVAWQSAAEGVQIAAQKHLYNKDRGFFYKGISVEGKDIVYDETIDMSSFFGAFMYGLFATGSDEVTQSFQTVIDKFSSDSTKVVKSPRYENDNYLRVVASSIGNPWIITSLWIAQYAGEINDRQRVSETLDWVESRMSPSGMLSEQISPLDGSQVSVSPLIWSHAEYVATLLDTIGGDYDA